MANKGRHSRSPLVYRGKNHNGLSQLPPVRTGTPRCPSRVVSERKVRQSCSRLSLLIVTVLLAFVVVTVSRIFVVHSPPGNPAQPHSLIDGASKKKDMILTPAAYPPPANTKKSLPPPPRPLQPPTPFDYDGIPDLRHSSSSSAADSFGSNLVVRSRRKQFTAVPEQALHHVVVPEGKADSTIRRIFREQLGWIEVQKKIADNSTAVAAVADTATMFQEWYHQAHIYFRFRKKGKDKHLGRLQPYQRYSRIPSYSNRWESKDRFLNGFREYAKEQSTVTGRSTEDILWFLPQTYRLTEDEADRQAFVDRLASPGGMDQPWVLKQVNLNNGRGIEMLPPHSEALETAVDRVVANRGATFIVQQYICNEMTWFKGQKFDLRMYWLVASVDPLIVLFEDGYVRAGATSYDEQSWNSTGQHLTNHNFRGEDLDVTHRHLWKRVQEHYDQHREQFQSDEYGNIMDPVLHVRNQMKAAIGQLAEAFKPDMYEQAMASDCKVENFFAFYGCDFILDADLNVWFIEAQASPGIGESKKFRTVMWERLFVPMIRTVEEIALKQQRDATANILPLENLGGWEVVYAGDTAFEYKGYKRRKQHVRSCKMPTATK